MKKSNNKVLSAVATFFILVSITLSPVAVVFADEKPKETPADSDKATEGDAAKDKKKEKDGEEPDCE